MRSMRGGTGVRFFFSADESATFSCSLDRRAFRACEPPKRYRRLRPGRHRFRVVAEDAAGNVDPTAAVVRFRIPRAPQMTRITRLLFAGASRDGIGIGVVLVATTVSCAVALAETHVTVDGGDDRTGASYTTLRGSQEADDIRVSEFTGGILVRDPGRGLLRRLPAAQSSPDELPHRGRRARCLHERRRRQTRHRS